MKKIVVVLLVSVFAASIAPAQIFIGSRQVGMGGTGVASAVGLNAIAYNPAGIIDGPGFELLLAPRAAYQGFDQIAQSITKTSDPAQFMIDNYANKLDANGSLSGILGLNIGKIGVSVIIPRLSAALSKPASSLEGSVALSGTAAAVLTLGRSFSVPGLPASLDVGANIKSVSLATGALTINGEPTSTTPITATQTINQGSGIGYDLGVRTNFQIPYLADFSVGAAMLDVSETIKYKPKTRTDTYKITPPGTTPELQKGTEAEGAETSATAATTTIIGCAGTVPGIGAKLAVDLESVSGGTGILAAASDSITHLGIEYPTLMGLLILRAGSASGQNTSVTTYGAKINLPLLQIEAAAITDNKNTKNNSYSADLRFSF